MRFLRRPIRIRHLALAAATLAVASLFANGAGQAHATLEDAITYTVRQTPAAGSVLQVGETVSFAIDITDAPGSFLNPVTYQMTMPANMTFSGYGVQAGNIISGCTTNAGLVCCTIGSGPPPAGSLATPAASEIVLNYTVAPAAAGATYSDDAIRGLFTHANSGFSANDTPDNAGGSDTLDPSVGALTVANALGANSNVTIATTASASTLFEGSLATITVTFGHAFGGATGPLLQPITATVANGDIQGTSISCPGGGTASFTASTAVCAGSAIANGAQMTFQVRTSDTSAGADTAVVVQAPSLGLTEGEAAAAAPGAARTTITVEELGLRTSTAPPAATWPAGSVLTVCTAPVAADIVNQAAAGAGQGEGVAGTSTFAPVTPLALGDFSVNGPGGAVAATLATATECGSGQTGVQFTAAAAGSYSVTARYNGDTSSALVLGATRGTNTLALTVETPNPVPSISAISPSSAPEDSSSFELTVTGSGFVPGSTVRWNGSNRNTTYVSATQLTATIPAADLVNMGQAAVTVYTDGPGGGPSAASLTFTIAAASNPIPVANSLSPATAAAGSPAFTVTITGSGFLHGSKATWNGQDRTTRFVSATQLGIDLLASDLATGGTGIIQVTNPTPGGGLSAPLTFTITGGAAPAAATLTSISPDHAAAGSAAFTLTVTGTNFTAASKVRWNGDERTTTFVSATQLTASIAAADIATAGTAAVTVMTGTDETAARTFTIEAAGGATTVSPKLVVTAPAGLVPRSRLAFSATSGDLAPDSVGFVIRRVDGGHYWNGETGEWQEDAFANTATAAGSTWTYAVTGDARRQFVDTAVDVTLRATKGATTYTSASGATIEVR